MTGAPPPPPSPWGGQPPGTEGWGNPQWEGGAWPPPQPPPGQTGGTERTGPLRLQPMALGDLLDGAAKLYRSNFKTVAFIALVFAGPLQFAAAVLQRDVNGGRGLLDTINDPSLAQETPGFSNGQLGALLFTFVGALLVQPLITGAISKAVSASYLGSPITAGEAIRAAGRRFPALLLASVLVLLANVVGLLGCCIGIIFVFPLWVLVAPSIVVEGQSAIGGMKRSWNLVTRRYWPVLGTVVLTYLVVQLIALVITFVPSLIALFIGFRWGFLVVGLGGIAASMLTEPIASTVYSLLYFDQRIRSEGFDLEVMARDIGSAAAP